MLQAGQSFAHSARIAEIVQTASSARTLRSTQSGIAKAPKTQKGVKQWFTSGTCKRPGKRQRGSAAARKSKTGETCSSPCVPEDQRANIKA